MKICVVGAGSIGGFMAVRLANAGHEVSVIARGEHLAAIKQNGLKLVESDKTRVARNIVATADITEPGPQDIVILAVKAHQIAPLTEQLAGLLGDNGALVTLQNGIPWWYFQKLGGEYEGRVVETVDPGGVLARSVDPDRIIGCIAYPAATIVEPGVIHHVEGYRFPLGELGGQITERAKGAADAFKSAGFKSFVLEDIRSEIWLKLWGNLTFNPISALTHSTLVDICQFPQSRELARTMMTEAQQVAERLGASFRVTLEQRIQGAENVGKHKTSMLQDVELGKALEIEGMLGSVLELADLTHTEAPALRTVYSLVSLLDHTLRTGQIRISGSQAQ